MPPSTESKRRKLEAALQSARATVLLLEAELDANDGEEFLDVKEAAKAFPGTSEWTIRRWALEGRMPATRGSRGKILVTREAVRKALESEPVVPLRHKSNDNTEDQDELDPYDALLASGTVVMGGRQ